MPKEKCIIDGCNCQGFLRGLCRKHHKNKKLREEKGLPKGKRPIAVKPEALTTAEINEKFDREGRDQAVETMKKNALKKSIDFVLVDGLQEAAIDRMDLLLGVLDREIAKLESIRDKMKQARDLLTG